MTDRADHQLELDDIPRFITSGFKRLPHATYFLVTFGDDAGIASARAFIAGHRHLVAAASAAPPDARTLVMAFSFRGISRLTGSEDMEFFDDGFREGMSGGNNKRRARILGDVGTNHRRYWEWGRGNETDMVLMELTAEPDQPSTVALRNRLQQCGHVTSIEAALPADGKEPFGFADGISQPLIEGLTPGDGTLHDPLIKPGEFILGYENEGRVFSEVPALDGNLNWGRNGSYFVLRQLRQDVDAFWEAVGGRNDQGVEFAAKLVGRWPDGAPLTLYPDASPGTNAENNFGYLANDQHGFRCPLGAHVRRSNPRDTLADEARGVTAEHARARVRQHRLIRRGRVYRREEETGIMFGALNASIEDQFEFVQHMYVNGTTFAGLSAEDDPIAGVRGTFTQQDPFTPERVTGLGQFVYTIGGGYFFIPGLTALASLGQDRPPNPNADPVAQSAGDTGQGTPKADGATPSL